MKKLVFLALLANAAVLSAAYTYSNASGNSQMMTPMNSTMNPSDASNTNNNPMTNSDATANPSPSPAFQPQMKMSLNGDADSSVLQNIRHNLTNYQGVSVSVYRGDVTLRGTIASQEDKDRIEREIKRISGVRTVDNQIQVVGSTTSPSTARG